MDKHYCNAALMVKLKTSTAKDSTAPKSRKVRLSTLDNFLLADDFAFSFGVYLSMLKIFQTNLVWTFCKN